MLKRPENRHSVDEQGRRLGRPAVFQLVVVELPRATFDHVGAHAGDLHDRVAVTVTAELQALIDYAVSIKETYNFDVNSPNTCNI